MGDILIDFLLYLGQLLLLTLGTVTLCGLAAFSAERLFLKLAGSGSSVVVYISSVIGTPIHELGHAAMCVLFGHKITKMRLLLPPHNSTGTLGYVEHSWNRKNPWARLGNLFIGLGPIFSGLGVIILTLSLCYPNQWNAYLAFSGTLTVENTAGELAAGVFSLLCSMPGAFADDWIRALIGLIIILSVSQHITLSGADIKGSLSALPLYLLLLLLFAVITALCGVQGTIIGALSLANLRMLSIFCITIAFSAVWIAIALLIYLIRKMIKWF